MQEGKHNEGRSSYGHSLVVDPWGQIITEQMNPGPGLLTCEIGPFTMVNSTTSIIPKIYHVRRSMPVEYHRRFDLFPMSDSGYPRCKCIYSNLLSPSFYSVIGSSQL